MKKLLLLAVVLLATVQTTLRAQADDKRMEELKKAAAAKNANTEGWVRGGGIGLDLAQLALFNPQVGAGQNRIGIGGVATVFFNYKKDQISWDNIGSMQLAVQKIGKTNPFQKSLDVLRFSSKVGRKLTDKMYISLIGTFLSQVTPTYDGGNATGELGAILSPLKANPNQIALSNFLSPAIIELAPGIDYKYDSHLSLFFSPFNAKYIIVADKNIANNSKGAFGTLSDGAGGYKTSRLFFGLGARATYTNKFWEDRIAYTGTLSLFTDYLRNFGRIDVDMQNNFAWNITKNLSLNAVVTLFYDDDISVNRDKGGLAPALSVTQAIYLKYNYLF